MRIIIGLIIGFSAGVAASLMATSQEIVISGRGVKAEPSS